MRRTIASKRGLPANSGLSVPSSGAAPQYGRT